MMGSILLAIHPTADCRDVPRDLPTFTPSSHFWETATLHHSVICIFKVFLMCVAFLRTGFHLWLYHPLMWGCEWFLQLVSTSANFGTSRFQPSFHMNNDSVRQCRYQHLQGIPLVITLHCKHGSFIFILCFLPYFFYFCTKIISLFYPLTVATGSLLLIYFMPYSYCIFFKYPHTYYLNFNQFCQYRR